MLDLTPGAPDRLEDDEPEVLAHLDLALRIRDPELLEELAAFADPREREAFALAALRVGVFSLRTARGQVDAQAVRGEVDRLLCELRKGLEQHRDRVGAELGFALREYFDPQDGRFEARVRALVQEDGDLSRVIRRHVEGSDSALARTLASHVGAESPLLRKLDPTNQEGLLAGLQRLVEESLGAQSAGLLREFSLDNQDGALARLVGELTQSHGRLTEDLRGRLDEVVREFSLDAEDSALSRLVARVERAQQQITAEFTLDCETSALARLRRELLAIAEKQSEGLAELHKRVEVELAKYVTARERDARSTAHGDQFQAALLRWLERSAEESSDVFRATAHTPGLIRGCKVGDAVIELGPEQQAAGARIVVEAKEAAGYTLAAAREEIETARKNRSAEVGLFVLSARCAPEGWPRLRRIGADLFVRWDVEDPSSDAFLEAALSLARALCARSRDTQASEVDFAAFERAIREVEKQVELLGEITTSAQTIERGAVGIQERVRKSGASLRRAVETLDGCCDAARRELATGD
jgi:hypothetical protein